jgi:hypothetical protein
LQTQQSGRSERKPATPSWNYNAEDLDLLLGTGGRQS